MKYLIVNADDFGLTKGVNAGIIESFRSGVVTSTTIIANSAEFNDAVRLAKENSDLGIGVQLNLTTGKPITEGCNTLVDKKGNFFRNVEINTKLKGMSMDQVHDEFMAQIEKVKNAGLDITHLSTQNSIHSIPMICVVVSGICAKYGYAIRRSEHPCLGVKSTELYTDKFSGDMATNINFKMLIKKYDKAESLEIGCRPGRFDIELLNASRYSKKRELELSVLSSYELLTYIEKNGIKRIDFGQLS